MRGNAGSASSRQDQNVPVSRQEHITGQSIFLFLLLVVLLLATGIWWWMKAGSSGDSAKALAAVAEKYRHAVGLVVLCVEMPNGEILSSPVGTAWAIGKSQFVSNSHVIYGLLGTLQDLSKSARKLGISTMLEKNKVKSEQELSGKLGANQYRSELKKLEDKIRQMFSKVYAEVRINGKKGKSFRISHLQPHPGYSNKKSFTPDVGIITIEGEHDSVFKIAERKKLYNLKSGVPIGYLGFPMERLPNGNVDESSPLASMQTGIIVAVSAPSMKDDGKEKNFLIRHNLPSVGGASGSPIFDTDGSVIAVNTASTSIPGTRLPSAALVNLGLRVDLIHGVGEKIPIREFLKLKM